MEQDVAEILEAFEEYKERTGTAPEKVQELKHGTISLLFNSYFVKAFELIMFFESIVTTLSLIVQYSIMSQ